LVILNTKLKTMIMMMVKHALNREWLLQIFMRNLAMRTYLSTSKINVVVYLKESPTQLLREQRKKGGQSYTFGA